ncbi:NlpC/P60 family protein [Actinoplanes sp. TBRC 11911]|uniref:C40 family peptidase n=1 Tax=Actinoplanes sp. TBRC 11911 TaxID=2729386 RepID=UPI00145D1E2C|nr:NlpC/P60 family protein [Actinoplanes sp. TBRC 11911]NMO51580.1 NlpC/P60 family protein [Actinoplanes sp. TBRC 11911]
MKRIGARRATVLRSLLCAIAAVGIVVTGPTVAYAVPSPSSVEAQIDKQWNELEPVIEQYNDTHNKLIKNQAQQKKLNAQITPLQVQVDVALSQVRGLATDAYMQGAPNAFNAMLVSGSPTGLTDKLMYLDQLAKHQQLQIAGVAALRDKYAATKADLDTLTQSIAARDKDLATKKTAIQKKIDALQKLRIQAYGASGVDDGPLKTGPCPVTYTNDPGGRAAQKACSLVGKPYVFGAVGPRSYDCSGLTAAAWAPEGVHLEHFTGDQINEGRRVSRADIKPGDLIFYEPGNLHHVAIAIGGGMMVHAPHTGDHVRMAPIDSPGAISAIVRPG